MNLIRYIFSYCIVTVICFSQSDVVTFSHEDSDTPSGYITTNTRGLSIAIHYDADKSGGTSTMVRGVWKSGTGGPSDDTDAQYSTLFQLQWSSQHGNNAGTSEYYSGAAGSGETHIVTISSAQIDGAISSNTSGRLYFHVVHGSTYDDDGYTGINIENQSISAGGANHFYLNIDMEGPTLSNIKGFKDPSSATEVTYSSSGSVSTSSMYINLYKIKYTVGSEDIAKGFIKWENISGGTTVTHATGSTESLGGYTYGADTFDSGESSATTYTYGSSGVGSDPSLTHGAVYKVIIGVMDARKNANTYSYNNVTYYSASGSFPTVTGVTGVDGDYKLGEAVNLTVTFSRIVDYSGTPQLTINPSTGYAVNIGSGDRTTALVFPYTVQTGHYSADLAYEATNSLSTGTYIRDLAGNNATLTLPGVGATNSLSKNQAIYVDGGAPEAFQVGSVTATGGNVVANKWNSTNTGISVVVPIADDASLIDGNVQLYAESNGTWRNLGAASNIDAKSTNKTITANAEATGDIDVEELGGGSSVADADVITMKAIIEDKSENSTTGSASGTTLTVDQTVPTIANNATGVTSTAGYYKLGESVNILVNFSENISVSGTPTLVLKTDNSPGSAQATVDMAGASGKVATFTYTVAGTHFSTALDYLATNSLSAGTYIRDQAGNPATLTLPDLTTLPGESVVRIDGVVPDAFTTGTVVTVGAPVVVGYVNEDNTAIEVTVPVANDASLENGKLQIQAKIGGNAYANVGSAVTIANGDLGSTKTVTVAESDLDGITGYSLGAVIKVTGRLEDYADGPGGTGNQTVGTESSTTLIVDQDDPAAFTVGAVTTVGDPVQAGKWNQHNTSVNVVVPIANEATLKDGYVQIIGKIASSSYEDVGDSVQITNANLGGNLTVNLTAAKFEAINTALQDGDVVTLSARIDDVAGNATVGTASSTTLAVDQTSPVVSSVSSNEDDSNWFKIGDVVPLIITFDGVVTVDVTDGTPTLALATDQDPGTLTATASYSSGSGNADLIFNYTVVEKNYHSDLDYRGTTSLVLNNGTIQDAAGNTATLTLPAIGNAQSLAKKKDLKIDGVKPALKTTGTVIAATTGTIRSGYYNSTNDEVNITVPLDGDDQSIVDGKIDVYAKISSVSTWTKVGGSSTIDANDKNAAEKVVSVNKSELNTANNFITNNEGKTLEFRVTVFDGPGNSIEYNKSASSLIIDTTVPVDQGMGDVVTVGGNVVDNYWNSTNTSANIVVKLNTADATLTSGEIVIQGSNNNGSSWADLRLLISGVESDTASIVTLVSTLTLSVQNTYSTASKYGVESFPTSYSGTFADGNSLTFRAAVLDRAGNKSLWTKSDSTLMVKETLPEIAMVTSYATNKAYKEGNTIRLLAVAKSNNSLGVIEKLYVTGTPILTLETGTTDATVNAASRATEDDTLYFDYTVAATHTSSDLNYKATTSLNVSGAVTVLDAYGNPLNTALPALDNANSLAGKKAIIIDTTPPSVRFAYDDPDSLVRFEDGTLVITATFSDSVTTDSIPKITVDLPAKGSIGTVGANGTATTGDITTQNMTAASANGTIFTYNVSLVDNSDGIIKVTMDAYDKALNPITADSTFDGSIAIIDNTDPEAFTTGLATMFGDTVSSYWFNKSTDSVKVILPMNVNDNSLLRGNIQLQMQVDGKMASDKWVTILPKDTILALTSTIPKYRTKKEVLDILTPQKLAQGDSVFIRSIINDQVGNETIGTQSASFFVLDTIPPAVGTFVDLTYKPDTTISNLKGVFKFLTMLRNDTLWTNDSLSFAVRNWQDPKLETEVGVSGIQRYEYEILQTANNDKNGTFSTFRSYQFQTDTLDTVIVAIDSLRHNRNYKVRVQAFDVAGNKSASILSNSVLRYNARPIGESIDDVVVKEDVLWEERWKVTDKDLSVRDVDDKHIGGTLLSDKFTFALTTMKIDTTKTPIDSTVVTVDGKAAVNTSGEVSFTPTKLDTAKYVFRVIVTDQWTLKDTVDINIRAIPVNDAPILNLDPIINTWAGKKLTFLEGDSSEHINLTRYAYDEDNDTTSLKYAFKIASTIPANIGYPIAKLGFLSDFGSEYKKSFINKLIDEFPASTIVQKNNSFLIYSGNIDEFKDPIKVDSLRTADSLFTWIMPTDTTSLDTNYYTESEMLVEFSVIDPEGLIGKDTVTFVINPINDKPVWTGVRDTVVKENDSLLIDFANYLSDVDDSTLTITIEPKTFATNVTLDSSKMSAEAAKTFIPTKTSYQFQSKARKDTVKIKPQPLWFDYENGKPRKGLWNPLDTLSNQIKFVITAADDEGASATDSFIVKVQRVPRPEIRMYVVQNNAFTNYYEVFLVDSLGKTKDITLEVQSTAVTLDTAAAYTYVGHYNFPTKGNYTFEAKVTGEVGDTSITKNLGLTLAKMYGRWSGKSVDGQFQVIGQNGSVDFDQSIMILDSTLFEPYFNDRASYLLGNESYRFKKSVEISLPGEQETAIYSRSIGSGWVELPSINEGSRVLAYTQKMGYFRIGPKTLIVPGQTSLQQNYPNPFNPATTIEYDLGFVDGPYQKVNITVYDILGRKIKLLVNEEQSIGRYQVRWDGKDQNGVPVSSGIYFVNLLTDMGRSKTKKVMLMR